MYAGRVIRPVWDQFVTHCMNYEPDMYFDQEGMWNERQRRCVQYKLIELRQFLEENTDHLLDLQIDSKLAPLQRSLKAPGLLNETTDYVKATQEQLESMIHRERV